MIAVSKRVHPADAKDVQQTVYPQENVKTTVMGPAGAVLPIEDVKTHQLNRRQPVIVIEKKDGSKDIYDARTYFAFWRD